MNLQNQPQRTSTQPFELEMLLDRRVTMKSEHGHELTLHVFSYGQPRKCGTHIIFYYGSLKRFAKNYVTLFFLPKKMNNAFEMSQSVRNEK